MKKHLFRSLVAVGLSLIICAMPAFAANTVSIVDKGISLDVYRDANGNVNEDYIKVTVRYTATRDEEAEEMSRITFALSATTVEEKLAGKEEEVVYLDERITPAKNNTYSFVIEKSKIKSVLNTDTLEGTSLLFKMGGVGVETAATADVVYSTPVNRGDIDGNGKIAIGDATIMLQHVAGKIELTAEQTAAADVTKDGRITIGDVTKMLQYIGGKITEL